jgi:anti-sigma factor RsiW
MTCAEFVELVTAYLEGALDRDTEQRFIEHMALCEGCDRYLQQIRETVAQLGQLPSEETLSGEVRDQLLAAFRTWTRQVGR